MATFYGTQNTVAFDSSGDATGVAVDGKYTQSKVHVLYDTYDVVSGGAGATGAGDTIRFGGQQIPAGAVILDAIIYCDTLVSTTVTFGHSGDPNAWNTTATTTTAILRTDEPTTGTEVLSADVWVTCLLSAAQTNAATRKITVVVIYATN